MSEMNKINPDDLEKVVGGVVKTVHNDAASYANIRLSPGLNSVITGKLRNGTKVRPTGNKYKKDGYVWYEVLIDKGPIDIGWIAGSLIGY